MGELLFSIEVNRFCNMSCPFCYARVRRGKPGAWDVGRLRVFLSEVADVVGDGFVVVYGDGEPLLTPRLTGVALRTALDAGASYTGFTTNGLLPELLVRVEEGYGGRLDDRVVVTVSVDTFKVLSGRRGRSLGHLWRRARRPLAANMWGLRVPEEPPASLDMLALLSSRGARVSINLLVTYDAPTLLPLIEGLVEEGLVEQVNVLAPKPRDWLLPTLQPLIHTLSVLSRLCTRGRCRLAVDTSVLILLGELRDCNVAGRRLYSVTVDGIVKPCSFAVDGVPWRPGRLREALEELRDVRVKGCPYLHADNGYRAVGWYAGGVANDTPG